MRNGTVDLAFVRTPTQPTPGVCVEAVLSEPMVAVVPSTMSQLQVEGVRYIPLQGRPPAAGLAIAYRDGPASAALAYAVDLTRVTANAV